MTLPPATSTASGSGRTKIAATCTIVEATRSPLRGSGTEISSVASASASRTNVLTSSPAVRPGQARSTVAGANSAPATTTPAT